jgi:hypothetical protein
LVAVDVVLRAFQAMGGVRLAVVLRVKPVG